MPSRSWMMAAAMSIALVVGAWGMKAFGPPLTPTVPVGPGPPPVGPPEALLVVLSCFHYYSAGFGLLRETTHRGIHLAFVLGLVFLVFPARISMLELARLHSWWAPGGVPLVDWVLGLAIASSVLYIPWIFEDLAFRVGNPLPIDVVMGSILVVLLLEATRRAMGWPLPVIAIVFMIYALAGPIFPGLLKQSGAPWSSLVNHLYMTSQGIDGIAVGVVATFVFHVVLFGVLATRIGLGKLFIDIASAIAGRYAGGPAKVSVFASALFGMLSGSSVATHTTRPDPRRTPSSLPASACTTTLLDGRCCRTTSTTWCHEATT